jgi:hypothetical protein
MAVVTAVVSIINGVKLTNAKANFGTLGSTFARAFSCRYTFARDPSIAGGAPTNSLPYSLGTMCFKDSAATRQSEASLALQVE